MQCTHHEVKCKIDQSVLSILNSPPYFWDQWGWSRRKVMRVRDYWWTTSFPHGFPFLGCDIKQSGISILAPALCAERRRLLGKPEKSLETLSHTFRKSFVHFRGNIYTSTHIPSSRCPTSPPPPRICWRPFPKRLLAMPSGKSETNLRITQIDHNLYGLRCMNLNYLNKIRGLKVLRSMVRMI